jgi:hypothetical protein
MSSFNLEWNDDQLAAEVQNKCLDACIAGARDVAIDAKMGVSVDKGDLLFSIEVVPFKKPDAVGAYVKAGADGKEHIANFVELGTPGTVFKSGKKTGKDRKPIEAKPYMRPALKRKKAGIQRKFEGRLR